jgi:hypothetical protein
METAKHSPHLIEPRTPVRVRLRRHALRAAAVLGLIAVVLLCLAATARAEVATALLALGAQFAIMEQPVGPMEQPVGPRQGPSALLVNGAQARVDTRVVDGDPEALLDAAQAGCKVTSDGIFDGVIRDGDDDRGYVACVVPTGESLSAGDVADLVFEVLDSGDISRFGAAHYVYAERSRGRTRVVTVTIDAGLHLGRIFPDQGDVPGSDVSGLPRPERSRRILAATAPGLPYQVVAYQVPGTAADVGASYRTRLTAHGWQVREGGRDSLSASRDGQTVLVTVRAQNDTPTITIATGL